jgi:RecA/RadA recombinase
VPIAAALRLQIERSLDARSPAALTLAPRTIRETAATGIASVDELHDGGLPVGAISEIVKPACSGRTSLALAFLAERTAEESFCAWVDAEDAFDPESAAASGVRLEQLLWVRCDGSIKGLEKTGRGSNRR